MYGHLSYARGKSSGALSISRAVQAVHNKFKRALANSLEKYVAISAAPSRGMSNDGLIFLICQEIVGILTMFVAADSNFKTTSKL